MRKVEVVAGIIRSALVSVLAGFLAWLTALLALSSKTLAAFPHAEGFLPMFFLLAVSVPPACLLAIVIQLYFKGARFVESFAIGLASALTFIGAYNLTVAYEANVDAFEKPSIVMILIGATFCLSSMWKGQDRVRLMHDRYPPK